jgi:hypothetical protein
LPFYVPNLLAVPPEVLFIVGYLPPLNGTKLSFSILEIWVLKVIEKLFPKFVVSVDKE